MGLRKYDTQFKVNIFWGYPFSPRCHQSATDINSLCIFVPKLHNNRPLNFVIVNLHLVKYKLNNKTKWLLRYYASLFNTLHSNRIRNENK